MGKGLAEQFKLDFFFIFLGGGAGWMLSVRVGQLCLLAGMCEIFLSQPGMRVTATHTMTSSAIAFTVECSVDRLLPGLGAWPPGVGSRS